MSDPVPDFAVNTYSFIYRDSALACMRHLGEMGFRRFEILVTPPHIWPADLDAGQRREVARALEAEGLALTSLNLPSLDHNLTSPNPEARQATVAQYRDVITLAGEWRAPFVVLCPGRLSPLFPPPTGWIRDWLLEGLATLAAESAAAGVTLLMENIPIGPAPRAEDMMEVLETLGDARVGIVYDVANGHYAGEDPAAGVKVVAPRLRLVHLSDTPRTTWRHDPVGTGDVDFPAFARALEEIGYDGESVMEIASPDPDVDLPESRRRLGRLGWPLAETRP
jgi:sugar phosphate isomerase/epimerase